MIKVLFKLTKEFPLLHLTRIYAEQKNFARAKNQLDPETFTCMNSMSHESFRFHI